MAEPPVFGALSSALDEEKKDPVVYGVYQLQSQNVRRPDMLQYSYGTGVNPSINFVRLIQTGQRTYDPNNQFDQDLLKEYENLYNQGQVPEGFLTPQEVMKQVAVDTGSQIAAQAGAQVGAALVDPSLADQNIIQRGLTGIKATFGSTPSQYYQGIRSDIFGNQKLSDTLASQLNTQNLTIVPELKDLDSARYFDNVEAFQDLQKKGDLVQVGTSKDKIFALKSDTAQEIGEIDPRGGFGAKPDVNVDKSRYIESADLAAGTGKEGFFDRLDWTTESGKSNWASSAGAAGVSFVTSLAMGEKPVKAAKRAAGGAVGRAIGTAAAPLLGPLAPVAPIVGSILGSVLGGRVICNELLRQKLMTKEQVILDYRFTRDYLTPQHVAGYHFWAIWMVRQMRKGKYVKLWKHLAGHRAKEIAYIYGEADRPDYLGKLYRKILEPICYVVGYFVDKKDWSILYKSKEV